MAAWTPGAPLGPYTLLDPIGSGGMGEVWKARDTRLNRTVAIKRLKAQHTARFEQEARAIATLNHPNICVLYDIGPDYLVMEYIEGSPLKGPLPVEEALPIAIQIAGALESAHGKGILHRDLKPANVMISATGAKLLDFGLAKVMTDLGSDSTHTLEGTVMGTAAYMSPEQAQGQPLDERSDVFSFGSVLYEVLSGVRAFPGDSLFATLNAIVRDNPAPFQSPAADILKRCLAKQPAQRFQNMTELKSALQQIPAQPPGAKPSIAVLPFANMSSDKDQEYFSDGLAEEILNQLAQTPGLKVIARTSSFAFRGKEQDIRKIAEALDVRTILEGSVRRSGTRVRVTAQLISAVDGSHLWSQRYDRELTDVFAVQDEISQAIAVALQVQLAGEPVALRRHTPNLSAYEAYLKARHYSQKFAPDALARARDYFAQAIALDPGFAPAHSGFGAYFCALAGFSLLPAHEAMPLVRAHARNALDLDPSLPEAHALLGVVAGVYDYDWKEAERRFALAIARETVPPLVRVLYAFWHLLAIGRASDARAQLERALMEDPLNVPSLVYLGVSLLAAEEYADADYAFLQALELDPNYGVAFGGLCQTHALRGMWPEALAYAEKQHALTPANPVPVGILAGMRAHTGDRTGSREVLARLGDGRIYGTPVGFFCFHSICGEIEEAANWLEKAVEQRDPRAGILLNGAFGKDLRASPRATVLRRLMNLPSIA